MGVSDLVNCDTSDIQATGNGCDIGKRLLALLVILFLLSIIAFFLALDKLNR